MSVGAFAARPVVLLQVEAFCAVVAAGAAYHVLFPHHWVRFALLFLVPDISLLMYGINRGQVASTLYNLAHTYLFPAVIGALAYRSSQALLGQVSLIWFCHIGMYRMLGYGLKYRESFKFTHLQSTANPAFDCLPDVSR